MIRRVGIFSQRKRARKEVSFRKKGCSGEERETPGKSLNFAGETGKGFLVVVYDGKLLLLFLTVNPVKGKIFLKY